MKYSETDFITNEQVLDAPYPEHEDHSNSLNVYTFIQKANFYKIFWIFIIGSIFGCYMEQIQYYLLRGIWESRAGVIWGPFSEIYGIGAILMFLLYHKIKNTSPLTIFCSASFLGSAFEYLASLFQEICFGSVTWDYSHQPFNIGGRTSLKYSVYWGLLGLLFIKWVFPILDKFLEKLKGKRPFVLTWVLIIFMSMNLTSSVLAVNRWSERLTDIPASGYIDEYFDQHYDNQKMEYIFPHMTFS